jgi:hypothetical protein
VRTKILLIRHVAEVKSLPSEAAPAAKLLAEKPDFCKMFIFLDSAKRFHEKLRLCRKNMSIDASTKSTQISRRFAYEQPENCRLMLYLFG